jgi:hypothetical protein
MRVQNKSLYIYYNGDEEVEEWNDDGDRERESAGILSSCVFFCASWLMGMQTSTLSNGSSGISHVSWSNLFSVF